MSKRKFLIPVTAAVAFLTTNASNGPSNDKSIEKNIDLLMESTKNSELLMFSGHRSHGSHHSHGSHRSHRSSSY